MPGPNRSAAEDCGKKYSANVGRISIWHFNKTAGGIHMTDHHDTPSAAPERQFQQLRTLAVMAESSEGLLHVTPRPDSEDVPHRAGAGLWGLNVATQKQKLTLLNFAICHAASYTPSSQDFCGPLAVLPWVAPASVTTVTAPSITHSLPPSFGVSSAHCRHRCQSQLFRESSLFSHGSKKTKLTLPKS
ncbi:uncharacterized protein LOC119175443 [Rhipicephalus microplus]|uniref:uncharacterized protein LOC119175443 n=1 Tax=Rhipicephalus microplus TaxID=6941 RepID=UPI003F6B29ED